MLIQTFITNSSLGQRRIRDIHRNQPPLGSGTRHTAGIVQNLFLVILLLLGFRGLCSFLSLLGLPAGDATLDTLVADDLRVQAAYLRMQSSRNSLE